MLKYSNFEISTRHENIIPIQSYPVPLLLIEIDFKTVNDKPFPSNQPNTYLQPDGTNYFHPQRPDPLQPSPSPPLLLHAFLSI